MARISFPSVFDKVVTLFKKVDAKDSADGASSAIKPFLTEQGIVLADDKTDVNNAVIAHTNFGEKEKLMEEKSELRDDLFKTPFKDHTGAVQFLKKLFRGNATKLGEWGQTVDGRGRVVYPSDFVGRVTAVSAFIDKHDSFAPGTSPLQPFLDENGIDLAANKLKVVDAKAAHDDFLTAEADKEQFREERDTLMAPVEGHLRGIGQFLVGLFPKTPKKAGQWGFVVDDSPQADKTRDVVVTEASSKVLQQLAVGKIIANVGSLSAKIYKGKTASGTPIVLNPGQKITVVRGLGTVTVVNESNTDKVVIEATFNR